MTTSSPTFWIVRDTASSPNHGVTLPVEQVALGAIRPGDWFLTVADSDGVRRVGRVLRSRERLGSTTFYFDHNLVLDTPVQLGAADLSLPTGPAARLRPEDFEAVLKQAGCALSDIPRIEDARYVRDLLELAVRDDLLGPAGGPHEYVVDMGVRDRYLVGKLAPRRPGPPIEVEPAGALEDEEMGELRDAPLHEPGAEFPRASGRVEPEDDALDEIDTTNNQSLVPSSIGLTFCVAPDVDRLTVEARWGSYVRVPNDEHDFTKPRKNRKTGELEEAKVRVWRRVPCGGHVALELKDGPIAPSIPDAREPEVRLQGTIRTNAKGERLVTVFLVNGQLEPETNRDTAWLFQPEVLVRGSEDAAPVFVRRPSNDAVVDDPERDHLGLIYRRHVEFAVGHGVAVHSDTPPDEPTRAIQVRTEVIPGTRSPSRKRLGWILRIARRCGRWSSEVGST